MAEIIISVEYFSIKLLHAIIHAHFSILYFVRIQYNVFLLCNAMSIYIGNELMAQLFCKLLFSYYECQDLHAFSNSLGNLFQMQWIYVDDLICQNHHLIIILCRWTIGHQMSMPYPPQPHTQQLLSLSHFYLKNCLKLGCQGVPCLHFSET